MCYWFIVRNRVSDNDFGYIFLDHNWYQYLFIICKKKSTLLRADFVSIYVLIMSDKITVVKIVSVINTYNFTSLYLLFLCANLVALITNFVSVAIIGINIADLLN